MTTPSCQLVACADCVLKEKDFVVYDQNVRPCLNDFQQYAKKLAEYVKENVRSDDDELVTPDYLWKELGIGDSAGMNNVKRFEICQGVRVMFILHYGQDWTNGRLFVGSGQCHIVNDVTKGQLRSLMKSLKIGG